MAATRLIALHVNKGKTAAASIRDRLDYALNSEKTQKGEFVSAYECDPYLAWREFSLAREMYLQQNVRSFERDVIGYQIRQPFKAVVCECDGKRIGRCLEGFSWARRESCRLGEKAERNNDGAGEKKERKSPETVENKG